MLREKVKRVVEAVQPEELCLSERLYDDLMETDEQEAIDKALLYDPL